ncbi:hypothetical protein BDR22DRAFT_850336 [Usnea florida]
MTRKSTVMLAPFFISVTIFVNSSRHGDFVTSTDVFSHAATLAHDSSNTISALSVRVLRCFWMGGKVVAATSDRQSSREVVLRFGIPLEARS